MNRKKPISILALALVMASCFALGASASGALQEIGRASCRERVLRLV